ncbi:MAG: hypothetical protein K1V88_04855, partial [Muribaculaceae bacterium]
IHHFPLTRARPIPFPGKDLTQIPQTRGFPRMIGMRQDLSGLVVIGGDWLTDFTDYTEAIRMHRCPCP